MTRPVFRGSIDRRWTPAMFVLVFLAATPAVSETENGGDRSSLLEAAGLGASGTTALRLSAFLVGSFSYNSHLQMIPEVAGGAAALADPGETNFRFDKFGLLASRTFSDWLSANAAMEVESHRDLHSHGFNPEFGCPPADEATAPVGPCIERFGAEESETEVNLDRFSVTAVAPFGNGVALTLGRVDVPFGIERHDEPLRLTATASEVFQFGRPERMTGFLASYPFSPLVDTTVWVVNRWENEAAGDDDFNDDNGAKTVGGRLGLSPAARDSLLSFGIGGFYGPEQEDDDSDARWVIDLDGTWSPAAAFLVSGEILAGGEENVALRERGRPIAAPATVDDVHWWGAYVLAHVDLREWIGVSLRYGVFDDADGGRTGVEQMLQSVTVAPIFHLSRLVPDLRAPGAAYARTNHTLDWVDMRLEYRFNRSDEDVFSDAAPAQDVLEAESTSHQFQLQVVVNL